MKFRVPAVAAIAALALSACGGPTPASVPAPGIEPQQDCGTVTIAQNPWVGYEANSAVVGYLAKNQLGCDVVLREEAETKSWESLAAGRVDVILENWGHDDLRKKYIDREKVAVEMGLTGNAGELGWYVPPWMVTKYPEVTDWAWLKTNADVFATPSSGGKGVLYDGDPTYVTNDAALVKNLGLNFTVQYLGSEDGLIKAFRQAEKDRTPMLGYFYSPQWLLSEVPLVRVELPAYTPGCDADPAKVACGYQPYDLDKIASKKFADSGSPAAELVKNFTWTDADQNQVARDITGGMTPDQAAKKWLDAHPAIWKQWLPGPAA